LIKAPDSLAFVVSGPVPVTKYCNPQRRYLPHSLIAAKIAVGARTLSDNGYVQVVLQVQLHPRQIMFHGDTHRPKIIGGAIPDNISSLGEPIAPAVTKTSDVADIVSTEPLGQPTRTPIARQRSIAMLSTVRGHRRIFPKSYARACRIDLLPFNRIRQPGCAQEKPNVSRHAANCCGNERLHNTLITRLFSLSVGFWEDSALTPKREIGSTACFKLRGHTCARETSRGWWLWPLVRP
jgi:hypothetical protein